MKKVIISIIIILIILIITHKPQRYGDVVELDTGDRYIINQYGNMVRYNTPALEELKELGIYGELVK